MCLWLIVVSSRLLHSRPDNRTARDRPLFSHLVDRTLQAIEQIHRSQNPFTFISTYDFFLLLRYVRHNQYEVSKLIVRDGRGEHTAAKLRASLETDGHHQLTRYVLDPEHRDSRISKVTPLELAVALLLLEPKHCDLPPGAGYIPVESTSSDIKPSIGTGSRAIRGSRQDTMATFIPPSVATGNFTEAGPSGDRPNDMDDRPIEEALSFLSSSQPIALSESERATEAIQPDAMTSAFGDASHVFRAVGSDDTQRSTDPLPTQKGRFDGSAPDAGIEVRSFPRQSTTRPDFHAELFLQNRSLVFSPSTTEESPSEAPDNINSDVSDKAELEMLARFLLDSELQSLLSDSAIKRKLHRVSTTSTSNESEATISSEGRGSSLSSVPTTLSSGSQDRQDKASAPSIKHAATTEMQAATRDAQQVSSTPLVLAQTGMADVLPGASITQAEQQQQIPLESNELRLNALRTGIDQGSRTIVPSHTTNLTASEECLSAAGPTPSTGSGLITTSNFTTSSSSSVSGTLALSTVPESVMIELGSYIMSGRLYDAWRGRLLPPQELPHARLEAKTAIPVVIKVCDLSAFPVDADESDSSTRGYTRNEAWLAVMDEAELFRGRLIPLQLKGYVPRFYGLWRTLNQNVKSGSRTMGSTDNLERYKRDVVVGVWEDGGEPVMDHMGVSDIHLLDAWTK